MSRNHANDVEIQSQTFEPSAKIGKRQGITLIEVTMAMFLGTFLLLVIFQSFFLAARFRMSAGESQYFGLSVTNSLRDLTSDLASCHAKPKFKDEQRENVDSNIRKPSQSAELKQLLGFQDSFSSISNETWVSFVGHSNHCIFQTATTHPRFNYLPENAMKSANSLIIWWHSNGQSLAIEGWLNGDLPITKTIANPLSKKGLIRTQFYLDESGAEQQISELMNPDVTAISFQYFNGKSLEKNWFSGESIESPRAVMVTLRIIDREMNHWISIPSSSREQ